MLYFIKYILVLVCICMYVNADVLLDASRNVFQTHDKSYMLEMNDMMRSELTTQLYRVTGVDPANEWDINVVRGMSDQRLTELMLLASIGNFTTGKSQAWHQPCTIVLNMHTGLLQLHDEQRFMDEILSVLIIIFCVMQLKYILEK